MCIDQYTKFLNARFATTAYICVWLLWTILVVLKRIFCPTCTHLMHAWHRDVCRSIDWGIQHGCYLTEYRDKWLLSTIISGCRHGRLPLYSYLKFNCLMFVNPIWDNGTCPRSRHTAGLIKGDRSTEVWTWG